jgi:hypothetical protein
VATRAASTRSGGSRRSFEGSCTEESMHPLLSGADAACPEGKRDRDGHEQGSACRERAGNARRTIGAVSHRHPDPQGNREQQHEHDQRQNREGPQHDQNVPRGTLLGVRSRGGARGVVKPSIRAQTTATARMKTQALMPEPPPATPKAAGPAGRSRHGSGEPPRPTWRRVPSAPSRGTACQGRLGMRPRTPS